jgi:uncharacterized protein (TIGR00251 family)
MVLRIRVIPRASRNLVKQEEGHLKVYLTSPAQEGLANAQLVKLLAEHFGVKKYQVRIIRGEKSRDKEVQIS